MYVGLCVCVCVGVFCIHAHLCVALLTLANRLAIAIFRVEIHSTKELLKNISSKKLSRIASQMARYNGVNIYIEY